MSANWETIKDMDEQKKFFWILLIIFLIKFEGYNKTLKHLVEKLDLSEYKLNNKGPNKYLLYAFITKSNEQYIAYVKDDEDDSYILYSNETNENKESSISFDYAPYYAIYKGIDLN